MPVRATLWLSPCGERDGARDRPGQHAETTANVCVCEECVPTPSGVLKRGLLEHLQPRHQRPALFQSHFARRNISGFQLSPPRPCGRMPGGEEHASLDGEAGQGMGSLAG